MDVVKDVLSKDLSHPLYVSEEKRGWGTFFGRSSSRGEGDFSRKVNRENLKAMVKATKHRNLIVLVGAGAANIEILRKHARTPLLSSNIILITPRPTKLLRNMLPWVISGEVRRQNAEIDLLRLCRVANAQLMVGEVDRVDLVQKAVILKNGGSVFFDYLSMSLGTDMKTKIAGPQTVPGNRLEYLFDTFDKLFGKKDPPKISIFGDSQLSRIFLRGIARLKAPVELTLITDNESYVKGLASLERFKINSLIRSLKATVVTGQRVEKNSGGKLYLSGNDIIDTDLLIIADEGETAPVFSRSGFPIEDGLVSVNDALQLVNCKQVYIAGPGVSVQGHLLAYNPNRPSNRFGKVIAENLRRDLADKPLIVFRSEHALASWMPSPPEPLSLSWSRMRSDRWKKWISKRRVRKANAFVCASSGDMIRSNSRNKSYTLICSRARLEGAEPQWVAQVIGRQILHQSKLKRIDAPLALQANLSLRINDSPKKMIQTKVSQVQAGLEGLAPSSLEVRVSSSNDESIYLSSELTFQPNLQLKPGDLIFLVGRLGSVQSLYLAFEDITHGESWYELRMQINQDYQELIDTVLTLGCIDGAVLDERGLIRNLEDLIVPNNLGASMDLDRIPIQLVEQKMAVDAESIHVRQNLEFAKYLPSEFEPLLHHPRFLALFGAEVSGLLLILPRESARKISEDLVLKFPKATITPVGALTEGPVRFKFRLTTR